MTLTSQDLIKEDLDVVRAEMLWAHDDLVQVALEQFGDHISVARLVKEFIDYDRVLC